MKRSMRFAEVSLPVIAVLLGVVSLIATNEIGQNGGEVKRIEVAIESVKDDNELMGREVASQSSLFVVRKRALELGLTEVPSYLTVGQEEVALRQLR